MGFKLSALAALVVLACAVQADDPFSAGLRLLKRAYDNCERSQELVKCLKMQAVKLADRAARADTLSVMDGVTMVRRNGEGRSYGKAIRDEDMKGLSSAEVDTLLSESASKLMETHTLAISPSMVSADVGRSMDEARGKLKKYIGPILTAIAIKGGFVAMAFQAIALIAGKALLIGKIALVLSAIIGLKKLVTGGDGAHEKTTYEIVKHPQVSHSNTFSSSHFGGGEFEGGSGPGGHYRRSAAEEEAVANERAYRAHRP